MQQLKGNKPENGPAQGKGFPKAPLEKNPSEKSGEALSGDKILELVDRGDIKEIVRGGVAVVPILIQILENDERPEWARATAAKALGKIGDHSAIPALVRALKEWDESHSSAAHESLMEIGTPAVLALLEALGHSNERFRGNAAGTLAGIGLDEHQKKRVIEMLDQEDENARCGAAELLGIIADPSTVGILAKLLLKDQKSEMIIAITSMAKKGADCSCAIPGLVASLKNQNDWVRIKAAEAIMEIARMHPEYEWKDVIPELIGTFGDRHSGVWEFSTMALGAIGKPAVGPLVKVLGDEKCSGRWNAIGILGKIGDTEPVPLLINVLENNEDINVKKMAAEALGNIAGKNQDYDWTEAAKALIKLLKNAQLITASAKALGKMGHPLAIPALFEVLVGLGFIDGVAESLRMMAARHPEKVASSVAEMVNGNVGDRLCAISSSNEMLVDVLQGLMLECGKGMENAT